MSRQRGPHRYRAAECCGNCQHRKGSSCELKQWIIFNLAMCDLFELKKEFRADHVD